MAVLIFSKGRDTANIRPSVPETGMEIEGGKDAWIVENSRDWHGSPLDMGSDMDPEGIREVVMEFANGDTDVFRPKLREEFRSYELHQLAAYVDAMVHSIRKGQRR